MVIAESSPTQPAISDVMYSVHRYYELPRVFRVTRPPSTVNKVSEELNSKQITDILKIRHFTFVLAQQFCKLRTSLNKEATKSLAIGMGVFIITEILK